MAETNGSVLHLLRVTLEAVSPLSSGTSDREASETDDKPRATLILRDANGLPMIAGASLQGVLAHPYRKAMGSSADDLFGCAPKGAARAARLFVGFGHVHDSHDLAVVGLVTDAARIGKDKVLSLLAKTDPLRRDHNELTHRLVSRQHHKYQRIAVPKGTRFSFELSLWGGDEPNAPEADEAALERCVALMKAPEFRLGGAANRGYGRIKVVRASYLKPDLRDKKALRELRGEAPSVLFSGATAKDWNGVDPVSVADAVVARLELQPIDFWRIGAGGAPLTFETHGVRLANGDAPAIEGADRRSGFQIQDDGTRKEKAIMAGTRDAYIDWSNSPAEVVTPGQTDPLGEGAAFFIAPGSSTKGILAHRAQFHFNRLLPDDAGLIDAAAYCKPNEESRAEMEARLERLSTRAEPLQALFGAGKERRAGGRQVTQPSQGRAARLRVDDAEATGVQWVQALDHNSIDRLTSGVRETALYAEELAYGGTLVVELSIVEKPQTGWETACVNAFVAALDDLCEGRLAIGAKSYGYCKGKVAWSGDPSHCAIWKKAWEERNA